MNGDACHYYHGSHEPVAEIRADGMFGGVFVAASRSAATGHGQMVHIVETPRPLSNYELNYEIAGAWDAALEIAGGDEGIAEAILSPGCKSDSTEAEDGWELQRLRGQLAARLGYTSVEMLDEHGTTWLCLPGCSIAPADTSGRPHDAD